MKAFTALLLVALLSYSGPARGQSAGEALEAEQRSQDASIDALARRMTEEIDAIRAETEALSATVTDNAARIEALEDAPIDPPS